MIGGSGLVDRPEFFSLCVLLSEAPLSFFETIVQIILNSSEATFRG
jgi:hypothetical protein